MTSSQAKTHEIKKPMTVTGLCTKDVEDPSSETFMPGKINRSDANFFQGL